MTAGWAAASQFPRLCRSLHCLAELWISRSEPPAELCLPSVPEVSSRVPPATAAAAPSPAPAALSGLVPVADAAATTGVEGAATPDADTLAAACDNAAITRGDLPCLVRGSLPNQGCLLCPAGEDRVPGARSQALGGSQGLRSSRGAYPGHTEDRMGPQCHLTGASGLSRIACGLLAVPYGALGDRIRGS